MNQTEINNAFGQLGLATAEQRAAYLPDGQPSEPPRIEYTYSNSSTPDSTPVANVTNYR
jgi:hypothetical protein